MPHRLSYRPLPIYRVPLSYVRPNYGVPLLASLDRGR
jgi:hypothetical protein